jgi:hypothetical protein
MSQPPPHRCPDRRVLAKAIKPIYSAPSAEATLAEVDAFERGPGGREVLEHRGRLAPRPGQGDPVLRLPASSVV